MEVMAKDSGTISRTEDEQKRAIEMFDSFRDELLKRQLSNTENYDKSILTLSSAGLAISLTFFKFIVPVNMSEELWLMKLSWICFLSTVILSLAAYLVSNAAITRQLKIAEDYYVNQKESAFNNKNWLSSINNWLNYLVGLLFAIAITTVVIFVILNFQNGGMDNMSDKENKASVEKQQPVNESAVVPSMNRVTPVEGLAINSANIPSMQAAPGSSNQSQSTEQQTTSKSSSSKE